MISVALAALVAGLLFGLSLIIVIGPQNTYLLQMGLRRQKVAVVVVICTVSDVVLICAGVAGAGAALDGRVWLLHAVQAAGALFLLVYAGLALRRALRSRAGTTSGPAAVADERLAGVVTTTLALTWLNPGVYLDTVVLLGSVANTHAGHQWWFATGAAAASALWFSAVGFGSRLLVPLFGSPRAGVALDVVVAAIMAVTAARLLITL